MNYSASFSKFRVFSIIWTVTTIFHQCTWTEWFNQLSIGWIITIFAILYLIFNRYFYFFITLAASVADIFVALPSVPNHMFFEWLINTSLLASILYYIIKFKISNLPVENLDDTLWKKFMPVGRITLVILYFYVVFHKLNSSFFDPTISCAGQFFEDVLQNLGLNRIKFINNILLENNLAIRTISIYFTLISEAIIPVLLVFKRTRNVGILYGLLFHLILPFQGHVGIYSFSAMIYVFYIFFWEEKPFQVFYSFFQKKHFLIIIFFITNLILVIVAKKSGGWFLFNTLSTLFWFIYSVIHIKLFYTSVKLSNTTNHINADYNLSFLWITPILVFINGLVPYLGLKTEFSYSMFSNLSTEKGNTNHYIIPATSQIFDYQKQIVQVIETDNEKLIKADRYFKMEVEFVLFEFVRILNESKDDFHVKFALNEKEYDLRKVNGKYNEDIGLDLNQNYLEKKFFKFRHIYTGSSLCQH